MVKIMGKPILKWDDLGGFSPIFGNTHAPPKINIEPENDGLEDVFPFQGCILRFHVNLPGCICFMIPLAKARV